MSIKRSTVFHAKDLSNQLAELSANCARLKFDCFTATGVILCDCVNMTQSVTEIGTVQA